MQTTHQLSNKNNILTQGPGVQETVNTQTFFFFKYFSTIVKSHFVGTIPYQPFNMLRLWPQVTEP